MRFSERIGARPTSIDLQIDTMSQELRNSLWNLMHGFFIEPDDHHSVLSGELKLIAKLGQIHFFKLPVDELPDETYKYVRWLKQWFMSSQWSDVYDFVEWLSQYGSFFREWEPGYRRYDTAIRFRGAVNRVLERERSGYRFVGNVLSPITNVEEVREIELAAAQTGEFDTVGEHIRTAIQLFSDRKEPDFRNSVKEAISAVEAAAKIVTASPKATLTDALKVLEKTTKLHSALKDGFSKIYGYTSDADGIRHGMMDLPNLNQADARFMLVACSAFANYLIDRVGHR